MLFFSGVTEEEHSDSKCWGENIPKLFSVLYSDKWALSLSLNALIGETGMVENFFSS